MSSLDFTFWDVQHGSATHILTPNGRHVVIDLGDGEGTLSKGRFSPLNELFSCGVNVIDRLVITHPHRDHLDDIDNVYKFNVISLLRPDWLTEAEIWSGNKPQDLSKVTKYLAFSNRFDQPIEASNDETVSTNWGGAVFRHYMSTTVPRDNLNNHSVVTVAEFAGLKALIPGDNEASSWTTLLRQQQFVKELPTVDVFLAPHHGREAGFCSDLFEAGLKPRLTIISDDQAASTSVTAKYGSRTRGWPVFEGGASTSVERSCITTRNDGTIRVRFGHQADGNYIRVDTESGPYGRQLI